MNVLFVHNNFPAQFVRLASALVDAPEHKVAAIGSETARAMPGVQLLRYSTPEVKPTTAHRFARRFDYECRRAEQVLFAASALRSSGFEPDVVAVHCGWGESIALRSIFPKARFVIYCEYYYRGEGQDVHFDEQYGRYGADGIAGVHCANASTLLALSDCEAGISPTFWQRSTFPIEFQDKIQVVHEGIDTQSARPHSRARFQLPGGRWLTRRDEVVTFATRSLEPLRGFTTLTRALPKILRARPEAQIVVVGADHASYGPGAPGGEGWKTYCLREVLTQLDLSRVHFLDFLPYGRFLSLLQISSAHIYLTYPFVLSWSLTEAMSVGCRIVGSDTSPVREAIEHGESGLLAPFNDEIAVADSVISLLAEPRRWARLGEAARSTILERFDYRDCVPKALEVLGAPVGRQPMDVGAAASPHYSTILQ
jgi:glycosyltransferase involved in cell wall biosynthesis